MNSFLTKKKTKESYWEKISTEPEGTKRNKRYAVDNFSLFVREKYEGRTLENIIEELLFIKKNRENEYDDTLYELLQDWINWNEKRGLGNYTIRVTFSNVRKFLFYYGIKTNEQDIKEYLRFGRIPREERHPLSQEEYRAIIDGFAKNPYHQALFLSLGSSGMRIGEALGLKKKDLDVSGARVKINIPPQTKTRRARSTYISKEAETKLEPILRKKGLNDYVFSKKNTKSFVSNYRRALDRLIKRLSLDEKYQSNGFHKITSHSFRSYFFTKAARKNGENYAHRMVGHGGYLIQYDRMTEEEKLQMYLKLEPDLVIFDQTKNELKIEKLREENESIEVLREEVKKLREQQANQDKRILDKMRERGILPTLSIADNH